MTANRIDQLAAVGDAADSQTWSGIPFHFWRETQRAGWATEPWRLELGRWRMNRRWWNLGQALRGRGTGGFQYSTRFLDQAEDSIPAGQWRGRILSFNQHFPRSTSVGKRGGRLVRYLDATFASFCLPGGLAAALPKKVRVAACQLERENLAASEKVVTMARWAADSAIRECGVSPSLVATILPGANLDLPADYDFPQPAGRPGRDRPLVLGFVGKDWKRKGLPFLIAVRTALARMDLPAVVRCAGNCPRGLTRQPGLDYAGFIDKAREPGRFVAFLAGCDLGCLFSEREPLGISTLEFLRAGVPVAGFTTEGLADTLPPDAGFRFPASATVEEVAVALRDAFGDESRVARLRANARRWSPRVTWERCIAEWTELLESERVAQPVQPWRGLEPS
jgi:glycosyltransferase involved in cell wall biosynthesis